MTPAPHTPINMVKGGNSLFFSAQCVALLAKCGYSPDDFGTYEQVQKRCQTAREKCALHDAQVRAREQAIADGVPEGEAPSVTAPAPSSHERFLATCQSGHIAQDASMRNSTDAQGNPGRGNPCANDGRVDGYETRLAPCMPHQGAADEPGSQHHLVSQLENSQPVSGEPPLARDGDYPEPRLDADCEARTDEALKWREETAADWGLAADNGAPNDPPEVTDASAAAYFEGTDPKKASDLQGKPMELTGQTAAECIESFRKAGQAEMKAKCEREVEKNRAAANGPHGDDDAAGAEWRDGLESRAKRDEQAAAAARKEQTSARISAGVRRDNMHKAARAYRDDPSPENRQKLREQMDGYLTAQQRVADAERAHGAAEDRARASRSESNGARYAQCRYEQGTRMRSPAGGSNNPRVPGYNTFADPSTSTGTASGVSS